jgi:hypothetical protein
VLNTAYDGAILVTIDRDELRVEPFIARQ